MAIPKSKTTPVSGQPYTTAYSIYPTRGGFIIPDIQTPEIFYQIMVGQLGSLIVESKDGGLRYYPVLNTGAIYPITGVRILSAATVDGQAVTTTADNIWWYGGY